MLVAVRRAPEDERFMDRATTALKRYGLSPDRAEELAITLASCYWQRHRVYHTINHINLMFKTADEFKMNLQPWEELAILFHDAVCWVNHPRNEWESSCLVGALMSPSEMPPRELYTAILDTKLEKLRGQPSKSSHNILDLDMAPMRTPESYQAAAVSIRQEIIMAVGVLKYIDGRIEFLNSMLERPQIYYTELFRGYEASAKDSMRRELESLEKEKSRWSP